ncbi:hemicentin-2-like [Ictalurus furcatus]|uniref:hemicentin-2-like n=1 Tax=Ictalurus furcatus TaxID=66913 RepID=UPI002350A6C1|nr:hemicentin-2-like [Ictalurus furcatus]
MYSVWNSVLSWVLLCLFSSIAMEDTSRSIVIEEPTTTTSQEGSCVTINCKFKYQDGLQLLWIKDPKWIEKEKRFDGIIVYNSTDEQPQVTEYSNRVEFFNDRKQSSHWTNCTLKIHDLKKNDSGNYTFRYIGSEKYISNTFLLTVMDNPCKVHIKPANLNKSIKEGDKVNLQCATSAACEFHPLWQSSGSSEILKSEQSKDEVEKRSELQLIVSWTDDGRTLTCRPSRSNDNWLERRVTLRVEYAPKETKVIESSSSKDVKEGEQVTISCSSKARPNANFTWIKHQSSFSQHGENLTLYNMTPEDGGKFYCLANNEHGSEKSNDIKINVIYAPKGVDINPKLAELKEGDRLTLTCLVQNSNPEVDMQSYRWYKDGQEINQQTMNTFTVPSVRQRDKGVYQCQARNSVGETMSTNITQVSVKYHPQNTSIDGTSGIKLGFELNLKCVTEAEPVPHKYSWYFKPEHEQQFVTLSHTDEMYQIEKVAVSNAGLYKCSAQNIVGKGANSTEINVLVFYPPKTPNLTMKEVVKEEELYTITCTVESSPQATLTLSRSSLTNPEKDIITVQYVQSNTLKFAANATVSDAGMYTCKAENTEGKNFSKNQLKVLYAPKNVTALADPGVELKEGSNLTLTCKADSLPEVSAYTWKKSSATHSQTVGHGQKITLHFLKSSDSDHYFCISRNEIGSAKSSSIYIRIKYAPKGVDINPKLAELKEGDRLTLTCLVQKSNPEVDMQSYRWYKDGQEINQQTMNTFTVPSVRQHDKGVYQCQARNSVGETMSTNITQVSVKYHPQNTFIDGTSEIKLGFELNLKCVTEADPLPHKYSWYFKPEHEQQFVTLSHTDEMYRIEKVAVSNAGLYKCSAQNVVGKGANSTEINVLVFYPPKTPNLTMKEVVEEEELYTITCTVESSPQATLTLSRSSLTNPEKDIITVQYVQSNILKFAANATVSDAGMYTCEAENTEGKNFSKNQLKVLYAPKNVTALADPGVELKEGSNLTLTCKADSLPEVSAYTWKKSSATHSQTVGHGQKITLHFLKSSDSDHYFCISRNEIGSAKSSSIYIRIKYAPKGVDINPKLAELKEGDRLTLTCLVQKSNPEVDMQSYRWYKDGQEINQQTMNTFTVPSVRQRDKGVYQCQARNSVGETMSTNITQVSVKYHPQNTFIDGTSEIKLGFELNLKCVTEADPLPHKYSWYFKPEHEQQFVTLSHTDEMYRIEKVAVSNAGLYKCSAQNVVGKGANSTEINVLVFYPPKTPNLTMKEVVKEEELYTITCTVESSPQATLTLSRSSLTNPEKDIITVQYVQSNTLKFAANATVSDAGMYTCKAENTEGKNFSKNQLKVLYAPKNVTALADPGVELKEGSNLTLTCKADSLPEVSAYTWKKSSATHSQTVGHGQKITLHFLKSSDSDHYFCISRNEIGSAKSSSIYIRIKYRPRITLIHNMTSLGLWEKAVPIHLSCSVQCDPPATFFAWYKMEENTTVLSNNVNYTVQPQNPGTYYCYARNEEGESRSEPVKIFLNHFIIKQLVQVIISLLVIVFLIGVIFLIQRIILRKRSAQRSFFFSAAPLCFLSDLGSSDSCNNTRENLVMEGSTELSSFRDNHSAVQSNPPANRNIQAGRPNSNIPSKQKQHHTEEDLTMTTVNYAMLQFVDSNNPNKSVPSHDDSGPVYADVSKNKQMAKKPQDGHEDYENVSGVCREAAISQHKLGLGQQ